MTRSFEVTFRKIINVRQQLFLYLGKIPDSVSQILLRFLYSAVAIAILGGYAGLIAVVKIGSSLGGKKVEAAPAPATSSGPSTGIPSIDSPEFDTFIASEAFEKLLGSDEELGKVLADMK